MVTKRKLALVSALTSTIVLVSTASQSASLDALLDPPHHVAERATDDATPVLSLDEAVRLSLIDQPILSGHEAVINANPAASISRNVAEGPVASVIAADTSRKGITE